MTEKMAGRIRTVKFWAVTAMLATVALTGRARGQVWEYIVETDPLGDQSESAQANSFHASNPGLLLVTYYDGKARDGIVFDYLNLDNSTPNRASIRVRWNEGHAQTRGFGYGRANGVLAPTQWHDEFVRRVVSGNTLTIGFLQYGGPQEYHTWSLEGATGAVSQLSYYEDEASRSIPMARRSSRRSRRRSKTEGCDPLKGVRVQVCLIVDEDGSVSGYLKARDAKGEYFEEGKQIADTDISRAYGNHMFVKPPHLFEAAAVAKAADFLMEVKSASSAWLARYTTRDDPTS